MTTSSFLSLPPSPRSGHAMERGLGNPGGYPPAGGGAAVPAARHHTAAQGDTTHRQHSHPFLPLPCRPLPLSPALLCGGQSTNNLIGDRRTLYSSPAGRRHQAGPLGCLCHPSWQSYWSATLLGDERGATAPHHHTTTRFDPAINGGEGRRVSASAGQLKPMGDAGAGGFGGPRTESGPRHLKGNAMANTRRFTMPAVEETEDVTDALMLLKESWAQASRDSVIDVHEQATIAAQLTRLKLEQREAATAVEEADVRLEVLVGYTRESGLSRRTRERVREMDQMLLERQQREWRDEDDRPRAA